MRLGSEDVLEKLVAALSDPGVGLSGTAQQLPRSQSEIVSLLTDSDMVTTQCCATRRDVLALLGNFHDKILRGVDPELRNRYRAAGLRIVIAPNLWHYHPMPASWRALWKMAYRHGYSSAYAQKHFPDTVLFNPEGHIDQFEARPSLGVRVSNRFKGLLKAMVSGRWGGFAYDLAYVFGYLRCRLGNS